ncbi:uncharacterized protein BP5553_10093 [Venustampulla echinocandica]|uniref:DUF7703 domain-containing protein n=1 Tax=Venustampulla echinocandica TaxID=2656787 RepID=A0A370TAA9_9HELO|nr:uncharacterized protein BP5553_10093 [Venustampulla echinocandica]RDL30748.1 hypothetical protein BP5553_10093 [Venustampulla echinocandica]
MRNEDGVTVGSTTSSFAISMTESAFMAIAFYNVIELHFNLFFTFKRWKGLYFWAVLTTMWGVAINGLGVVLETFVLSDDSLPHVMPIVTALLVGWVMMVTGQSVVLYSRIHLVASNQRLVRGVLCMIIFTVVTLHIPVSIVVYVMKASPGGVIAKIYDVYEPVQLTIFTAQEVIISGIYIYSTIEILRPILQQFGGQRAKNTFQRLIYINLFIIMLDITLISLQYAGYDELQHFYKTLVYSLKLKLEFVILNQLVEVTKRNRINGPDTTIPSGSATKYMGRFGDSTTKRTAEGSDNGYSVFVGSNNIALEDADSARILKTTRTVVEHKESPTSDYATKERKVTEARLSQSSSQVQLAEGGFE